MNELIITVLSSSVYVDTIETIRKLYIERNNK